MGRCSRARGAGRIGFVTDCATRDNGCTNERGNQYGTEETERTRNDRHKQNGENGGDP
jgi:hypothetical protein